MWTPREYEGAKLHGLPVLYLPDGQNLFSSPLSPKSRSKPVGWQVDKTAQKLIDADAIPPLILVGIDNAGAKRADEYTPVVWNGTGGRADDHEELLVSAIKPFIDRRYRTGSGPESTALGGSSLGGLFALYTGLRRQDVFGGIMAMSPSVYWGKDHILTVVEQSPPASARIWVDVGRKETATMRTGLRKVQRALKRNARSRDREAPRASIRAIEDAEGRHDEASWGRRFGTALRFLFPANRALRITSEAPADDADF